MAVFEYKAIIKATGKTAKGVIDADSLVVARRKLREQAMYPTWLQESKTADGAATTAAGARRASGRVSTRDLALMTRQLATLLRAGMPLVEALGALLEQTSNRRLQGAIYDVRDRVNSGVNLADAMGAQPRVFSPFYVSMVHAGEISGALEVVLKRLADITEHQAKLKAQVLSAVAYPAFMAIFALAVIVFLLMVIVPRITRIFEKQDAELPGLTKALIALSGFIGSYWYLILGAGIGAFMLWRWWLAREKGRMQWDKFKLRIPLFGMLHIKMVCARFSRTLGTMLQSGLTMLPALDVVSSVVGNVYIQSHMEEVKAGVRRGRDLAVPLKETGIFPPMLIHMVDLGQRSGEIETMLIQVAETYDDDVRLTIDAVVGLLEPVIIVVMGVFIGMLVMAILLPILKMSTQVGK